jgi:hypothetical protein
MPGSCPRLLAILLVISLAVIALPPPVVSQSDRVNRTPDTPSSDRPTANLAAPASLPVARPPSLPPPVSPPILPPVGPTPIGFRLLVHAAGAIFSGTVTAVAHKPATHSEAIETVAITFHVEQAIRGSTPGENLTIRQWMGVWSGGQRYRVGERVLLFLYLPSKLGLTSSVAGALGRFTVDPVGRVLLSAQHLSAFQKDAVLGGKPRLRVSDFAAAVRKVTEEEAQ